MTFRPFTARGIDVVLVAAALAWGAGCGSVEKMEAGADDGGDAAGADDGAGDDGGDDDGAGDDGGDADGADDGDDGGDGPGSAELCVGASGSRLRRLIREHDDGTSEVIAMRDTELGGDCRFQLDREGSLRCLPVLDGHPFAIAQSYYSDSGCSNGVAMFTSVQGAPPSHAVYFEGGTCSIVFHYYELGAALSFPAKTPIYYRALPSGLCTESTVSTTPGTLYFALGAEMAPARFVAATESFEGSGRLGARTVAGDDGSRLCDRQGPMRDAELDGQACQPERAEDGVMRCLPLGYSLESVSSNSSCSPSVEAAGVSTTCDAGLEYVRDDVAGACNQRSQVRGIGDQLSGPFYHDTTDGCDLVSDRLFFAPGDAIDPAGFAELSQERVALGGRLERIDMVGDGVRLDQPIWFDTELATECQFQRAADGQLRCFPGSPTAPQARAAPFYTDAKCEGATVERAAFRDPCGGAATPRHVVVNRGGMRLFEIGQQSRETLYEYNGGCSSVPSTTSIYAIGAEVPVNSLVSGTEVVEP